MSLRDRLRRNRNADARGRLYDRFGILENPFPASNQTTDNPHYPLPVDEEVEDRIFSFLNNRRSEVVVVVGTQGVGKTNCLNHFEEEIKSARQELDGYYVVRYLADPEASFEGTTRRLFEELGVEHLHKLTEALRLKGSPIEQARGHLTEALRLKGSPIEQARGHDMRTALRRLMQTDNDDAAELMMEWLLGHRLLKAHRQSLEVQFRLDTVESKTAALRDLVQVSGAAGVLKGIFLLLDELEKQGGVLGPRAIIRYLSAVRAIVDALPKRLFLMLAVTPDALERYSFSLPALRSRLENRIELSPLTEIDEAVKLAHFYTDDARRRASRSRSEAGGTEQIVGQRSIENLYRELESDATRRGDTGVRQREFLHRLHRLAEPTVQAP